MAYGWRGSKVRLVPLDKDKHLENALLWLNDPEITELTLIGDTPIGRLAEEEFFERFMRMGSSPDPAKSTEVGFAVETLDVERFEPARIHEIGVYAHGVWYRLIPRPGTYDTTHAVESIDADIVQRKIFEAILGIPDPTDARLTFVGGNRDALYLKQQVDDGAAALAVTLAPVTIEQFIEVCRQNRIMPPKSTWFQPKIRSGLVMALLD